MNQLQYQQYHQQEIQMVNLWLFTVVDERIIVADITVVFLVVDGGSVVEIVRIVGT